LGFMQVPWPVVSSVAYVRPAGHCGAARVGARARRIQVQAGVPRLHWGRTTHECPQPDTIKHLSTRIRAHPHLRDSRLLEDAH
jgi:hypothetical protein